jgi:hypothetical protein
MTDIMADQENYDEKLLEKFKHPIAGTIVVPTGGIKFSKFHKEKYKKSPDLK